MYSVKLKCNLNSQFHFGRVAVDPVTSLNDTSECAHSDTIYSAIVNICSQVQPEKLPHFLGLSGLNNSNPEFSISSSYFYLTIKESTIFFLPKPLDFNLYKTTNHKFYKKIRFVSKEILAQKIHPEKWADKEICTIIQNEFIVLNSELVIPLPLNFKIYSRNISPKVAVHKEDKKDSFYYQSNIQIASNDIEIEIGYYFLINFKSSIKQDDKTLVEYLIRLIPSFGLGGDRSSGCGSISNVIFSKFNTKTDADKFLALSLTNPASDEEFNSFSFYQIVPRGGRQTSQNSILKKVNMIAEGSIIKNSNVTGRIVDISSVENIHYYRYGLCFILPY
jgi:CRISPR-associated protein Csm4